MSAASHFEHVDGIAWIRLRGKRRSTWPSAAPVVRKHPSWPPTESLATILLGPPTSLSVRNSWPSSPAIPAGPPAYSFSSSPSRNTPAIRFVPVAVGERGARRLPTPICSFGYLDQYPAMVARSPLVNTVQRLDADSLVEAAGSKGVVKLGTGRFGSLLCCMIGDDIRGI